LLLKRVDFGLLRRWWFRDSEFVEAH